MYLHLGQNVVVPQEEIIGIFDMDNTTGSIITRRFLNNAENEGLIINVSDELPSSFIVSGGKKHKVYLSQLSPQTLYKRAESMRLE